MSKTTTPKGTMKISTMTETVETLIEKRNRIRFDLAIQRNLVWSNWQKSLFIHSLIEGYPVPPLYIESSEDIYLWMIDGKQRNSTIYEFFDGKLTLSKDTSPVVVQDDSTGEIRTIEIEGKTYHQLDEIVQKQFKRRPISVVELKNITPEQRDEVFRRLNSGSALTKLEMIRVELGEQNANEVNRIADSVFFSQYINLGKSARDRFIDHGIILQILLMMSNNNTDIEKKDINKFVKQVRDSGFGKEKLEQVDEALRYLEDSFGLLNNMQQDKILKRTHVPIIFFNSIKAKEHGVTPEEFGEWAVQFWIEDYNSDSPYAVACQKGSLKKAQVQTRLSETEAHLKKYFKI
ncbi:DUF262 domain-containing protein [Paenibacillus alvei]|uniref:DUF262 domain-containing protein n=1 Tax=Paenibacillus alvei TaxID=44250 RepID=UPI0022826538|nr:DUF262 domain-containing protein [Paenibacillus alvei]MCY9738123.1 DUF262 domain-containing protein [Paenibacillus alvei]